MVNLGICTTINLIFMSKKKILYNECPRLHYLF